LKYVDVKAPMHILCRILPTSVNKAANELEKGVILHCRKITGISNGRIASTKKVRQV
jgi:hypothetical protein